MSKSDLDYQNTMYGLISNAKNTMLDLISNAKKRDIDVQIRYLVCFECKIGFLTSKYDIWPHFECQNKILNVKIRYSGSV